MLLVTLVCGSHCSSILHKSCTNLFHFVLKHLFSPKFLLAIFTPGFASDWRLLQPKSCCNSVCHGDVFLGIWRPPDSRRLQDTEKAKCLVLLNTVVCRERLYWAQHPMPCYVAFLYISEEGSTGFVHWFLGAGQIRRQCYRWDGGKGRSLPW